MSKSAVPTKSSSKTGARKDAPAEAAASIESMEEQLISFWEKNRMFITVIVAIALLAILGYYGWGEIQSRKDAELGRQFSAATTPEALRAFVAANPDHPLAALAQLKLADELYTSGSAGEAIDAYEKAASMLEAGPFRIRANMGRAIAQADAGQAAAAESGLKQIADDTSVPLTLRTEAMYHLVNMDAQAGRSDEVERLSDQLIQLDPGGAWAQRALIIRAEMAAAQPAPSGAAAPTGGAPAAP